MALHAPIPNGLNIRITCIVLAAELAMLFALPQLMARSGYWALLLLPFAWVTIVHWALIHEAIHKHLHSGRAVNERLGRLLSVSLGASFSLLRFGHLMHHRLNRALHSEYVARPSLKATLRYYWNLCFGVYVMEVTSTLLLAFLPARITRRLAHSHFFPGHAEAAEAGNRFFFTRDNIANLRTDTACILALYTAAFCMAGAFWPVILALLAVRAFSISFTDNLYHYATPADNSRAGKELRLPRAIGAALLNSHYHETHHLNPDIPWPMLPLTSRAQQRRQDGSYLSHAILQFDGPLVAPRRI